MRLARCLLRYRGVAISAIIIKQVSIFFNFHIPFNLPSLISSSFSSYSYPSTPTLNKHPILTYYSHTTITYSHHPPPVTTNLLSSFLFPSPNSLVKPLDTTTYLFNPRSIFFSWIWFSLRGDSGGQSANNPICPWPPVSINSENQTKQQI